MINSHQERYITDSGHEIVLRKYNNTDNPLENSENRFKVLFTSKTLEKYSTITHVRNIENVSTDEDMVAKFTHKFGNIAMAEKICSVSTPDGKVAIKLLKRCDPSEAITNIGWVVLPMACECDTSTLDLESLSDESSDCLNWFSCWLNGDCWEFQVVTPSSVVPMINDNGYMYGTEEQVSEDVGKLVDEKVASETFEESITELLLQLAHRAHCNDKFWIADKLRILAHDVECFLPIEDEPETLEVQPAPFDNSEPSTVEPVAEEPSTIEG